MILSSVAQTSPTVTPWTAARKASLPITNSQTLLKLMSNKSVISSNHLILCHPLLLQSSILPSIRVFSNESALCISWRASASASASASVLLVNIQDWFPLRWTGCISLLSKGFSRGFSNTTVQKHWFFPHCLLYGLSHLYRTTRKSIALTVWPLSAKWCLCFLICCLRVLQLFF